VFGTGVWVRSKGTVTDALLGMQGGESHTGSNPARFPNLA
jgi:hypothetical protein